MIRKSELYQALKEREDRIREFLTRVYRLEKKRKPTVEWQIYQAHLKEIVWLRKRICCIDMPNSPQPSGQPVAKGINTTKSKGR